MIAVKSYPTPIGGLVLAMLGSFVFWGSLTPQYQSLLFSLAFIIGLSLLLPLLFKFIRYPSLLWEDLKHPTIGSALPTLAMATLFLSKILGIYNSTAATLLWLLAFTTHAIFFLVFLFHQIRQFEMHKIIPGWFVPPIGIVVACLTVPTTAVNWLALAALFFGITSYFILLPIMLYRFFLHTLVEDARKPTLAIFAAPPSLCLAGYLTLIQQPNPLLVLFLLSIAMLMTVTVYIMLFHLLRLNFSPAFSSYTFPLVISGTALFKASHWMQTTTLFSPMAHGFLIAAFLEASIATIVVFYVLLHYLRYIFR